MRALQPGQDVNGWLVTEVVGRGSAAVVYRVEDAKGQVAALKVPHFKDDKLSKSLRREARALAGSSHPNVVRLIGLMEDPPALLLEFVEGTSLAMLKIPVTAERAERLLRGILSGLGHLHARGLVHRDIKPANILLSADDTPRLADLGIVKGLVSSGGTATPLGEVWGTPRYMAPERFEGECDARSDLFAVGAVVHRLLTGKPAFSAKDPFELMESIRTGDRDALPASVPAHLRAVVDACLEPNAEARVASCADLLRILEGDRAVFVGSIVGNWRVGRPLGRGGQGEVFRATHLRLGTHAAIKVVANGRRPDRLLREARIQADLDHPNIVRVTDLLEVDDGLALVMDEVEGPTLAELLASGPVTTELADRLGRGLLQGLAHAHQRGVVHRDLKPTNVLIDGTGAARLADFGLARDEGAETLTREGPLGTPGYLAPEQLRSGRSATSRSDVFSAGAVLYEVLSGAPAFGDGELWARLHRTARGRVPALAASIPARMRSCIEGALHPDPEKRWADGAAMLQAWTTPEAAAKSPDRRWLVAAAALAGVGGLAWWNSQTPPETPLEANLVPVDVEPRVAEEPPPAAPTPAPALLDDGPGEQPSEAVPAVLAPVLAEPPPTRKESPPEEPLVEEPAPEEVPVEEAAAPVAHWRLSLAAGATIQSAHLEGGGWTHLPGEIPPGIYTPLVIFPDGKQWTRGPVELRAGEEAVLTCDDRMKWCSLK